MHRHMHACICAGAIISSGPCLVPSEGWGPGTEAAGYDLTSKLMRNLNVTSLDELRGLPAAIVQWDSVTLNTDDDFSGYSYDGHVLTAMPADVYSGVAGGLVA